jgi:PEP-CTERM motif
MRLILGVVCCFFMASVCRAEFTFQGISRGVFGLTNIIDNEFVATGSVGNAFGQQDSFITPSVAWVNSSVVNDFLPGFDSHCTFYLSVTQPTDALLMLTGNSNSVRSDLSTGPPDYQLIPQFSAMQPYSYKAVHLDPSAGTYSFSVVNGPSALSYTSLTIADLGAPQSMLRGDLDRNGKLDSGDSYAMMLALSDVSAYESAWRLSPADFLSLADVDQSGAVSTADLQSLQTLLRAPQAVPEPGTLAIAAIGMGSMICWLARRKFFRAA